jgi:hypothetical protein
MALKDNIKSQYHASLDMLGEAVARCPENLWLDDRYQNRFWHLAYHALFYTHLYLHPSGQEYKPWAEHREESEFMGPLPWPPYRQPKPCEPYTQQEVLAFLEVCRQTVDQQVSALDLEASSGFDWLPLDKTELQFYNIRHLMLHTGELCERLGEAQDIHIGWVGQKAAS